jgi:hypothetical protein
MFVIVVYIPTDFVSQVISAMASEGAGHIGNYRACSFQIEGRGYFEPMQGARPHIGEIGVLEEVAEVRVEMVCDESQIKAALLALIKHHPYETPAYHVLEAKTLADFSG